MSRHIEKDKREQRVHRGPVWDFLIQCFGEQLSRLPEGARKAYGLEVMHSPPFSDNVMPDEKRQEMEAVYYAAIGKHANLN